MIPSSVNPMPEHFNPINAFLEKEDVTVLVVDSGLGGMAICADIARNLPQKRHFKTVSLIYFNAWPEPYRGYNRLGSRKEQIETFDRALYGMQQFKPDFIMLACNTLSVLYPATDFHQYAMVPVVDIVDFGVNMMAKAVQKRDDQQLIILGTVTTIDSGVHRDRLMQKGIAADRIVQQPCDQLATAIENGPDSSLVADMVHKFMYAATLKINPSTEKVYAALCCTHFGYCQDQFQKKLSQLTGKTAIVLNPNHHMTNHFLFACEDRGFDTHQHIKVVSKIKWGSSKIRAISQQIAPVSSQTAQALCAYAYIPGLF